MQQLDIFVSSVTTMWNQLASFVPQLFAALVLLLVGWLLARIARAGVERLLKAINFDAVADKSGLEAFIKQAGVNMTFSNMLGYLVYWMILLIMIVTVANSLNLSMVADLFNRVVLYIPNVIVAILVLVFGTILARFINRVVFAWLNCVGFAGALTVSTFSEYAMMVFVFFAALEQLQIANELISAAFIIAFGAIGLAFAIAFGLGAKDAAQRIIEQITSDSKRH